MHIGIDVSPALRKHKTGVEWYVYHCVSQMLQLESSHTFLLYADKKFSSDFLDTNNSVQQKYLPWPFALFWSEFRLSYECFRKAPDVLFVPGRGLPLIHPKKTITAIHDLGFFEHDPYRSRKRIEYLKWSNQFAVSHASHIITFANFTKEEIIKRYGISEKLITVIPHAYDNEIFHGSYSQQEVDEFLDRKGIKKPYIVSISRIDGRKNIIRLTRAFEKVHLQHEELSLVLAGPLGFFGDEIKKAWEATNCASAIQYLSWIEEREKALLLQGAACFVFPSLFEGFGIPVLEAQGSGVPVLCSSTTTLPEVVGEGALFFDPLSIDNIAEKINQILSDHALSQQLIQKGLENTKRFSWKKTAEKTLEILVNHKIAS